MTSKREDEGYLSGVSDELGEEEELGTEEEAGAGVEALDDEGEGARFNTWCPKAGGPACIPLFPRQSVNLLSAPSNTGKTTLLRNVLKYRQHFFDRDGVKGLIYVNCNARNDTAALENPFEELEEEMEVLVLALHDIEDVDDLLKSRAGYVVVLDDVVAINATIEHLITYATHHSDVTLFVVTQSLLSNKLFSLLYKVHTVTLFFGNSSTPPLARHLLNYFFLDDDTKRSLKSYFSSCEKNKLTCVVKLNNVASAPKAYKKVQLFAGIDQLFSGPRGYCVVYPEANQAETLSSQMEFGPEVDDDTLVLVKARYVIRKDRRGEEGETAEGAQAADPQKSKWTHMFNTVVEDLKQNFEVKKWKSVIGLFKEILRVNKFTLGSKADGYKTLLLKGKKLVSCSLIDFIYLLTRRSHPLEKPEKYLEFLPFIKLLLKKKVPKSLIKNQKALELGEAKKLPKPSTLGRYGRKRTWQETQSLSRGGPPAKRSRFEEGSPFDEGQDSGDFSEVSD